MTEHDPLCPHDTHPFPATCETCALIARVRADERESIAQAIEAVDPVEWALAGQDAGRQAAAIAREDTVTAKPTQTFGYCSVCNGAIEYHGQPVVDITDGQWVHVNRYPVAEHHRADPK